MNLTDIKKKADAKIAAAKTKQEENRRLRELDIHPLVKWKCDRNVREAYFQGVVFAALTNDLKIDETEQKILSRIGNSLAIPKNEQAELTVLVQKSVDASVKAGGTDVFVPLEDCVRTLKNENIAKLFIAEYVKVCGARELDVENVREQLADHVAPQTGVSLKPAFLTLLYRVVSKGKNALDLNSAIEMLRKLTHRTQSSQRIAKRKDSAGYLSSLMYQNSSPFGEVMFWWMGNQIQYFFAFL